MLDIDDIYSGSGTYIKGDDLVDCDDLDVTIAGVEIKVFDDGSKKAVLSFEETDRKLVVNRTNALMIAEVAGTKITDKRIGQKISLFSTKVEFGGKLTNGVRVRPPSRKATGKKAAFVKRAPQYDERNPPPHGSSAELDDEVPFAPEWRG